jgi:hypothetical protein
VSRRLLIGLLVAVPLVVLGVGIAWTLRTPSLPDPFPDPQAPALPDLAMSPLTEVSASKAAEGEERYLEFTAAVSNVGNGPLIVHAVRADERGAWRVSQRFDEPDGSLSESVTEGEVVWGGHGHDHWHVHLGASYWLTRPGSTERLRRYDKVGFCFFDQRRLVEQPPSAPALSRFPKNACSTPEALEVTMGLSPGWSDPYPWTLPDQRLLVSGLEDGVYRLWATADPADGFRETNEANNLTWVDVRLTLSVTPPRAEVVRRGPAGASAWIPG